MAKRRATAGVKPADSDTPAEPRPDASDWHDIVQPLDLSPQQARIVELILSGKKDKEIAAALGLSKHTIRCYLNRIFARLGINDRVGLVVRVFSDDRRRNREAARCPTKE